MVGAISSAHASGIGTSIENSWLTRFIRNPSQETDPLRHLLILGLGQNTIAELTNAACSDTSEPSEGIGPQSCKNPICVNVGAPWEGTSRSIRRRHARKEVRHATCYKCKQTVALETSADADKVWIVDRGPLWNISLSTMWYDPTLSLRELSRRLDADPLTTSRHAVKLGLSFPRYSARPTHRVPTVAVKAKIAPRNLTQRRTSWLFALKQSGSQTKARLLEPATYAWLRRNDYRWLMENRPSPVVTPSRRPRVNWSAREALFVARLAPARELILKKVPPQRCSAQLLAREIGAEDFLRHLHRMPVLETQLRSLSEDKIDFATRRIVAIYHGNNGKGSYSRIRKLAGVRSSTASLPAVHDYISRRCPEIY